MDRGENSVRESIGHQPLWGRCPKGERKRGPESKLGIGKKNVRRIDCDVNKLPNAEHVRTT